jgi:hypothetical protein
VMTYAEFMSQADEATKAVYEKTLAEMSWAEFRKASHFEYAEALVGFGQLERQVFPIMKYGRKRPCGSRTMFRRVGK